MQVLHLFASHSLYLVKSCGLKAAFAHPSSCKHRHKTHKYVWDFVSVRTDLPNLGRKQILRNKKAHNSTRCTGGSVEYKVETKQKNTHFHKEIMEKCRRVRLSRQSFDTHTHRRVYYHPSLFLFKSLVWPLDSLQVSLSLILMYMYTKRKRRSWPHLTST